jgi:DNA polymerase-3 subunit gamma/tau
VIEQPAPVTQTISKPVSVPVNEMKPAGKLGSLSKIRQQVASKNNTEDKAVPLTEENLQKAWAIFVEKLAEKKNHSAVTNFKLAELKVTDEHSFEIITGSNIQQKFIESERSDLITHVQQYFKNRFLKYQLKLEEQHTEQEPDDKPLSAKAQYQLLAEQYPMIRELRDRLKLDLD